MIHGDGIGTNIMKRRKALMVVNLQPDGFLFGQGVSRDGGVDGLLLTLQAFFSTTRIQTNSVALVASTCRYSPSFFEIHSFCYICNY
jgi:hypothetical protein